MPERIAWRKVRPRSAKAWHQARVLCAYVAVIAVFLVAGLLVKNRRQSEREQSWQSASALIEDVQPKAAIQVESQLGGGILYDVAILAKYSSEGNVHERWITVEQQAEPLGAVQLQAFRWKGQRCIVRWQGSEPERVVAEVH
jgi:hypothetical protein